MSHDYLFLFHTPLGVIELKKRLTQRAIAFTVIDAPRQLSAECGMGVCFTLTHNDSYSRFISEQVKAVYHIETSGYIVLWKDNR